MVRLEYLTKWKDGSPDTWEEGINLSEDLIREYDERWWTACRKGDFKTLASMLEGGRQVRMRALGLRLLGHTHASVSFSVCARAWVYVCVHVRITAFICACTWSHAPAKGTATHTGQLYGC